MCTRCTARPCPDALERVGVLELVDVDERSALGRVAHHLCDGLGGTNVRKDRVERRQVVKVRLPRAAHRSDLRRIERLEHERVARDAAFDGDLEDEIGLRHPRLRSRGWVVRDLDHERTFVDGIPIRCRGAAEGPPVGDLGRRRSDFAGTTRRAAPARGQQQGARDNDCPHGRGGATVMPRGKSARARRAPACALRPGSSR